MAARKPAAKKAPTAKKAPVKAPVRATKTTPAAIPAKKIKAVKERYSKTQMVTEISEKTELTRKQVSAVLDELTDIIEGHTMKRSCGEFVLPGLLKIVAIKKPAKKARKGINPFTGEATTFAAKPASTQIKIRPLKRLKEMPL